MTLFNPILDGRDSSHHRSASAEIVFIKAQGLLFTGRFSRDYEICVRQLIMHGEFDSYISSLGSAFREGVGVFTAISCVAAVLQFGACRSNGASLSVLRLAYEETRLRAESSSKEPSSKASKSPPLEKLGESEVQASRENIRQAAPLTFGIFRTGLHRSQDVNVYSMIHVYLAFVWSLCLTPGAMSFTDMYIPWHELIEFLNKHAASRPIKSAARAEAFPKPSREATSWLLLEDFILRGLIWTEPYLPEKLFTDPSIDWEEQNRELPSMAETRDLRIQWLAHRIASDGTYINYNEETKQFFATPTADKLQAENPLPALPEPSIQPTYGEIMTPTLGEQKGNIPFAPDSHQHRSPRESQRKTRKNYQESKQSMSKPTRILKRKSNDDVEMTDSFLVKQEPVDQPSDAPKFARGYGPGYAQAPFGES